MQPYAQRDPAFAAQVAENQARLRSQLAGSYDFIVCGAGAAGCVIAARIAESGASVLLLEAGGWDDLPEVAEPGRWTRNFGSDRLWPFDSEPNPGLNDRVVEMNMGKVLGGGSSVNPLFWLRGHRTDWEHYAEQAGSDDWSYASVLGIYRRIESWKGRPDTLRRGTDGPVEVRQAPDPSPLAAAFLEAARSSGVSGYDNHNGEMMEGGAGAAITELILDGDGNRRSVFRAYAYPVMTRANLIVLTNALATRVVFEGDRAAAVDCRVDGRDIRFSASREIVLSAGAVQTPKLLLQSGVGDRSQLDAFSIPVVRHVPGVGRNFQNHAVLDLVYSYKEPILPRNSGAEALMMWRSNGEVEAPELMTVAVEVGRGSPELMRRFDLPGPCWGLKLVLLHPRSVGSIHLSGSGPGDPPLLRTEICSEHSDLDLAVAGLERCRALVSSSPLAPFVREEVMPAHEADDLAGFVRDGCLSFHHPIGTASMGQDEMAVVDAELKVRGVSGLRVADASVLPRLPTGGTMAPCVVVGVRAADMLIAEHRL